METTAWWAVGLLGGLVIALFCWYAFRKKQEFNAPLLGLLTLGLVFLGIAIIKPDHIKYGDVELGKAKKDAQQAAKLATEAAAMLIWNEGRFGVSTPNQEEVATKLLQQVHGDKALEFRYFLQHKGVLATPADELRKVPQASLPAGFDSPLYDQFFKDLPATKPGK